MYIKCNYNTYYRLLITAIACVPLLAPGMRASSFLVTPESFKTAFGVVGVTFFFIYWLLCRRESYKLLVIKSSFYTPIVGFLVWSIISLAWIVDGYLASLQLIQFVSVALLFFIVVNSVRSGKDVKDLLFLIVVSSVLVSLIGLLQLLFDDNEFISSLVRTVTAFGSTFGNKNMASQFIVLSLPLSFIFFYLANSFKQYAFFSLAIIISIIFLSISYVRTAWLSLLVEMFVLMLFLTYVKISKKSTLANSSNEKKNSSFPLIALLTVAVALSVFSAYIKSDISRILFIVQTIVVATVLFIHVVKLSTNTKKNYSKLLFITGLIAIISSCLVLVGNYNKENPESKLSVATWYVKHSYTKFKGIPSKVKNLDNERIPAWRNTLELIKENPIKGIGIGQWAVYYPLYYDRIIKDKKYNEKIRLRHLHNDYLEILANLGLIGALFIIWLLSRIFRSAFKIFTSEKNDEWYYALAVVTSLVGFSITSFFSFPVKAYLPILLVMVYLGLISNISTRRGMSSENLDCQGLSKEADSQYFIVFNNVANKGVFYFLILALFAVSILSYKWIMSEHYYNVARGVELSISNDQKLKAQVKLEKIEKSIAYNPYPAEAQTFAGLAHLEVGNTVKGIEYLNSSLSKSPFQSLTLELLAKAYLANRDIKNQLHTIEKLIDVDSKNVRGSASATLLYRHLDRSNDAILAYERMKANYNYFKGREGFGPYYIEVGKTAQAVKDYEYAKIVFMDAVEKFPKNATYNKYAGAMYYFYPETVKERRLGLRLMKRALELDPKVEDHEALSIEIEKHKLAE